MAKNALSLASPQAPRSPVSILRTLSQNAQEERTCSPALPSHTTSDATPPHKNPILKVIPLLLSNILPRRCLVCESSVTGETPLCARCRLPEPLTPEGRCARCFTLAPLSSHLCHPCIIDPSPMRAVRFLWHYEGVVADVISAMKYRPSRVLARVLALHLVNALPTFIKGLTDWDAVVPIPSSARQRRIRGFNQCEILARALPLPTEPMLLVHAKDCHPQATVEYKKRTSNVQGVFTSSSLAEAKSVLLVDDVITSGATAHAAAETLLLHGARTVDLLCLARATSRNSRVRESRDHRKVI